MTACLTERGRRDAKKLGVYLARHAFVPDRALVSTCGADARNLGAARRGLRQAPPVDFDERLYNASPQAILQTIKETGPETGTLLVIGHNPGLQELAAMLVASGDIDARERLGEDFPTSALAAISFAAEDWSGVHPLAAGWSISSRRAGSRRRRTRFSAGRRRDGVGR